VQSAQSFSIDFPAQVAVEAMLKKQLFGLLPLLRVEERVFLVLEVGVPVDPKQVDRSWLSLFLLQHSQLQESTSRRYLDADCVREVIDLGKRWKLVAIFRSEDF
jgi:hypothetical protein